MVDKTFDSIDQNRIIWKYPTNNSLHNSALRDLGAVGKKRKEKKKSNQLTNQRWKNQVGF